MNLDEALKRQHDVFMSYIQKDLKRYEQYESDDVTAIGLYLTDELLRNIDTFIDRDGPIKNLQIFARLAIARELEIYEISTIRFVIL